MQPTTHRELKYVRPGDPVKAEDWNRLIDVLGAVMRRLGLEASPGGGGVVLGQLHEDIALWGRDSKFNRLVFDEAVAGGSDPWKSFSDESRFAADPQGGIYLTGERVAFVPASGGRLIPVPGARIHIGKYLEDLAAGDTAQFKVWDFDAETSHTVTVHDWAGVEASQGDHGLVYQLPYDRDKWVPVFGGGGNFKLAKLNETLYAGSVAQATEITWNGSSFSYGSTFTVRDFFMNQLETVPADTKFIAKQKFGTWWATEMYCLPSDTLPVG